MCSYDVLERPADCVTQHSLLQQDCEAAGRTSVPSHCSGGSQPARCLPDSQAAAPRCYVGFIAKLTHTHMPARHICSPALPRLTPEICLAAAQDYSRLMLTLDGFSAPLTAGNFAVRVQQGEFDNRPLGVEFASVICNPPITEAEGAPGPHLPPSLPPSLCVLA